MIDELNFLVQSAVLPQVQEQTKDSFTHRGISFIPKWQDNGTRIYKGNLKSLQITMTPSGLFVRNSWHKFSKNENYSDYTYTDLEKTYYEIEEGLGLHLDTALVKRVAYACNLVLPTQSIYNNWQTFKTKEFETMRKVNRGYGKKCVFSDYNIKGYDKTLEMKLRDYIQLSEQVFRYEKEVRYMRHLHKQKDAIGLRYVKDILNKTILERLGQDLAGSANSINYYTDMKMTDNLEDNKVIALMTNKEFTEYLKNYHRDTYKRNRARLKKIINARTDTNEIDLGAEIRNKFAELLNG